MEGQASFPAKGIDQKFCQQCTHRMHASATYCPQCGAAQGAIVPTAAQTSGLAIASLVLGILWLYWLGSILAVIFGHVALARIRRSNGALAGRGMATAGLVLGYVGIAVLCLAFLAGIAAIGNQHMMIRYQ